MCRLAWLFLSCLILLACNRTTTTAVNLPQDRFIQVYFNHLQTNDRTYIEPYRQIKRSGDNLEAVIVREIETARQTIDLAVQELNLPKIAIALTERKRAGVRVRVILDNNYSRSLINLKAAEIEQLDRRSQQKYRELYSLVDIDNNQQLSSSEIAARDALTILQKAGIEVIDDTADGSKGSGLMHHKFLVIDGRTVVTGSANFTLSGVFGDFSNLSTRGNINHLLRIDNQQVASLFTTEFNHMWGNPKLGIPSQFGLAKPWRAPQTIIWQDTKIIIQFSPTSQQQNWSFSTNGSIGRTLENATQSIDLALFVFSEQKLADILQQQRDRGIEIAGVFDAEFAYRYYSEVLDLLGIALTFRCRVETNNNPWSSPLTKVGTIDYMPGDKLHHKFAIIDDQTVISGSQNWSRAANRQNDEVILAIDNKLVAQHFMQEFDRLFNIASFGISPRLKHRQKQQMQKCS